MCFSCHRQYCFLAMGEESVASLKRNDSLMFFIRRKDCRASASKYWNIEQQTLTYLESMTYCVAFSSFRALRLFWSSPLRHGSTNSDASREKRARLLHQLSHSEWLYWLRSNLPSNCVSCVHFSVRWKTMWPLEKIYCCCFCCCW